MAASKGSGVYPEPPSCSRAEILHKDIGALEQRRKNLFALIGFHIKRQRFFGSVKPDEIARIAMHRLVIAAGEVAAVGSFDLDDASPQIGELARRIGRGDRLFETHDGDSMKR